jgi:hypothetical protein
MAGERFVLLGLAHVRSAWFREVARWSTSAALPVDFVKTVSVEEVRTRLRSGRAFSALLLDGSITGLDRDLVDLSRSSGCAVVVVDDGRATRDWTDLGISAVLPAELSREDLLDVLEQVATPIGRGDDPIAHGAASNVVSGWRGRLVAVTGSPGAGASTIAMALTQGLADDVRYADMVVLADLALRADQAMLHDARDVVPGIIELVEAHRSGAPTPEDVRALTFLVAQRRYHLLLGLRRHRDWTAVRPRAFDAALDGLRRTFRAVVADIDSDLEGEAECGSVDVEERNLMARVTAGQADVVLAVGRPGLRGVHGLLRVLRDLLGADVAHDRILPVITSAPRSPRGRAEITATIAALLAQGGVNEPLAPPIFVSERRRLDDVLRDAGRLPAALTGPPNSAVKALFDLSPARASDAGAEPERLQPGSLGSWSEELG